MDDFFKDIENNNVFEKTDVEDGKLIFKIHFDNGQFLKYLVNFIYACVSKNQCWLKINEKFISVEYSEKIDKIQYSIFLNLFKNNFISYYSIKNLVILINPKQLQKLCNNIKKKDKIFLSFIENIQESESKFLLNIFNSDIDKEEIKCIPFLSYYSTNDITEISKPLDFSNSSFSLFSSELANLKKSIGTKKELVLLEIENNDLIFTSLAHGITTLKVKYKNCNVDKLKNNTPFNIYLSGNIISILSKMEKMCKILKFYKNENNDDELNTLKIFSNIDIPYYLGEIDIYIISPKTL